MDHNEKSDILEPRDPVAYPRYPKRPQRTRRPMLVAAEPLPVASEPSPASPPATAS